jgi:hypothetical protein
VGHWEVTLSELESEMTYYFRPYLRIRDEVIYGTVNSFTTKPLSLIEHTVIIYMGAENSLYQFSYADFEKMKAAGVWENTLLVFTADHASYPAPEFRKTFRTDRKEFIGRIPLFFYSAGLNPGRIDAGGRNSLDLAPTVLDLLGLTSCPNYFLGTSLFLETGSELSYMSAQGTLFHCTKDGVTVPVSTKDSRVKVIESYYKINMN